MSYKMISQTPVISGTAAYTSGDALGGKLVFAQAARWLRSGNVILGVTITDKANQKSKIDLVLFDRDFTAVPNHAPFAVSDSDLAIKCLGRIVVLDTDYTSFADNCVGNVECYFPFSCSGIDLYGQLVAIGTPTYGTTSDITVTLNIERD